MRWLFGTPEVDRQERPRKRDPLGELLLKTGRICQDQLQEAVTLQAHQAGSLGTNLVTLDYLTDQQLLEALSELYGVPVVDLINVTVADRVIKLIPAYVVRRNRILPVAEESGVLTVAMADPCDVFAMA